MKRTIIVTECDFCGAQTDEIKKLVMPDIGSETSYAMTTIHGKETPVATFTNNAAIIQSYDICPECLEAVSKVYHFINGSLQYARKIHSIPNLSVRGNTENSELILTIDKKPKL